uniref:Uncharacterized protein n=1 Tax=Amblyomma tuberculatum TaxID=48802 RepID=A0A6M2E1H5_9ACAR
MYTCERKREKDKKREVYLMSHVLLCVLVCVCSVFTVAAAVSSLPICDAPVESFSVHFSFFVYCCCEPCCILQVSQNSSRTSLHRGHYPAFAVQVLVSFVQK